MFNSNNGYSLADVAAATRENSGLGDFGGGWWAILLVALLFGWGGFGGFGNGFGNAWGGNGTPQFMSTMNTDYIAQGLRDIQGNLASNFLTLNNETLQGVCDVNGNIANSAATITSAVTNGFNTQNLANLQNTNSIQRDINAGVVAGMQNTYALQSTLANMASDNRADTAQLAYNQATNTCAITTSAANNTRDIVDAINNGNQMLANMLQQNRFDDLQTKYNDLRDQLQRQTYLADNAAQTNQIVNELRPSPIPAYQVSNPYCNCGNYNGCGCGGNRMVNL